MSGQSMTRGPPVCFGCRRRNQALNVSGANIGICRLRRDAPQRPGAPAPTTGQMRDRVRQTRERARPAAPTSRSSPSRRRAAAAAAPRNSATGTRPCRSPCPRSSGIRFGIPCKPGRGRAPREPRRSSTPASSGRPGTSRRAGECARGSSASPPWSPCSWGTWCRFCSLRHSPMPTQRSVA